MTSTEKLLPSLKTDLGMMTTVYDERLKAYLTNAYVEITRQGATLKDDDTGDDELIVMYAAWMWRRRDSMEGMPRMLRYALNNRILQEKMKDGEKGEVKVDFQNWPAISKDEKTFIVGDKVLIKEIIGNKLIVEELKEITLE